MRSRLAGGAACPAGFPHGARRVTRTAIPAADQHEQRGVDAEPDPQQLDVVQAEGAPDPRRGEQDRASTRDGIRGKRHGVAQPGHDIFVLHRLSLPCARRPSQRNAEGPLPVSPRMRRRRQCVKARLRHRSPTRRRGSTSEVSLPFSEVTTERAQRCGRAAARAEQLRCGTDSVTGVRCVPRQRQRPDTAHQSVNRRRVCHGRVLAVPGPSAALPAGARGFGLRLRPGPDKVRRRRTYGEDGTAAWRLHQHRVLPRIERHRELTIRIGRHAGYLGAAVG